MFIYVFRKPRAKI